MGIGVSIFLIAIGAIMTFAIDAGAVSGIDLDVVGWILMIVGAIGLVWSLFAISAAGRRGDTIVERRID
jgi:short subunit fatty acids transporter